MPFGPPQLPYYNRLSAKRKARGSYIRAVNTSKQKPEQKVEAPARGNGDVTTYTPSQQVHNDAHVKGSEVTPPGNTAQHAQVMQTLTERKEVSYSLIGVTFLSLPSSNRC